VARWTAARAGSYVRSSISQRGKSRNPNNSTTDFTDFTDKKDPFPIREIREIRGKKSSARWSK
jgi:hypothetical protein